jgi:hypothetical protein
MAAHSRRKGSTYERKLCRKLSEWWLQRSFEDVRAEDLPFRRTPLSGGFEKGADVRPNDLELAREWVFSVEAKCQESLEWFSLIEGNSTSPILKWWRQCEDCAKNHNKIPLLIFTKNLHKDFTAIKIEDLKKIDKNSILNNYFYSTLNGLCFMKLDEFTRLDPKLIKEAIYN